MIFIVIASIYNDFDSNRMPLTLSDTKKTGEGGLRLENNRAL